MTSMGDRAITLLAMDLHAAWRQSEIAHGWTDCEEWTDSTPRVRRSFVAIARRAIELGAKPPP